MLKPAPYGCDAPGCTKEHTPTNGWWAVHTGSYGISLYTWDQATEVGRLDQCKHFCGAAHALQFVSNEMGVK